MRLEQTIATVASVGLAVMLALALQLTVRKLHVMPAQRRRALKLGRYGLLASLATLLVIIWSSELRAAALLLGAFAVAIVIATKEVILCGLGWWVKLNGAHFRTGDRVQIGALKGDVVDYGVLTTTLLEVTPEPGSEQRTGRLITLPNSVYLDTPVHNETRKLEYTWHRILVVVAPDADWRHAETTLLACGQDAWAPHRDHATDQLRTLAEDIAQPIGSGEPEVFVSQRDDGRLRLELNIGLPVRDLRRAEDRILRAWLEKMQPGDAP